VSPAQGNSGPAHVPWTPAPASRRRTALGAPCVPAAPGRRKNIGPSSSETKLRTIFFSTRRPARGSSEGSACPRVSEPNEDHRTDAEDLAELGQCKATPIRSKQIGRRRRRVSETAMAESCLGVVTKKRRRSKHERVTIKIEDKIDQTRGDRRVCHAVHRGEKTSRFWLYNML
jgi:hypothetical protein